MNRNETQIFCHSDSNLQLENVLCRYSCLDCRRTGIFHLLMMEISKSFYLKLWSCIICIKNNKLVCSLEILLLHLNSPRNHFNLFPLTSEYECWHLTKIRYMSLLFQNRNLDFSFKTLECIWSKTSVEFLQFFLPHCQWGSSWQNLVNLLK